MTQSTDDMQKMLVGQLYNPLCSILNNQRKRAKALCYEYNQTHPDQKGKKQEILSKLFNRSFKPYIEPSFYCDYGYNISLGKNFYANHNCTILDAALVTIGDGVMFGPGVSLSTATHPLAADIRAQALETAHPIHISNNVWVGMGAQILAGVSIGENSVIGAGAVVTADIPANVLAMGVPAKIIRKLS